MSNSAKILSKLNQLDVLADRTIANATVLKKSVTALKKELDGSGASSGSAREGADVTKLVVARRISKMKKPSGPSDSFSDNN